MGFPVAYAYYKNNELCSTTSRSKGYNLYGGRNKSSFCAEYRLYKKLSSSYPNHIKNKGKKLLILVDINGINSKPCRNCQQFYTKMLPYCRIRYKENGKYVTNYPELIENTIYSNGFNKYKR